MLVRGCAAVLGRIFIVFIVSMVFLVRLASGNSSCNESIYTIVCVVFITQQYAMKIRREFLVYEEKK